ncbi:putative virion structural protein [Salmonella phage SPFM8]|nr:putative virion structural protein [Salmonella phage SPFM8]
MAEHIDPSLERWCERQMYLQLAPKVSNLRVMGMGVRSTTSAVATESRRGALQQLAQETYVDRPISRQVLEDILYNPTICNKYSAIQRGSKVAQKSTRIVRRIDKLVTFDWVIEDGLQHQNVCFSLRAIVREGRLGTTGWIKPNRERGPLLAEALENPEVEVKPTDQMCNGLPVMEIWAQWIERNEWIETRNVCMHIRLAGNLFGEEDHPQYEQGMSEYAYNESKHVFERSNVFMRKVDGYYYVLLGALNIFNSENIYRYNCVALAGVNKGATLKKDAVPNNPLR